MNKLLSYKPPRIATCLMVVSTGLWYVSPTYTLLYLPYELVAGVCIVAGFAAMILSWLQLKRSDTAICPTAKTSRIVGNGLYRYSRNPMYLGMFLILMGTSFIMGSIPSMFAPVVFFLIIDKVFIPFEEEKLQASFGASYSAYMAATRRWL